MGKKKKLKKSNGNEMKKNNWISWKTFKNLFRSDKKTSKDIQDGSEATVSETDGASSKVCLNACQKTFYQTISVEQKQTKKEGQRTEKFDRKRSK